MACEPGDEARRVRMGRKTAGGAPGIERPLRRLRGERLEQLPGRALADREIGVVRLDRALEGRVGDADAEPHADQRLKELELGLLQRMSRVIAGEEARDAGHRVAQLHRGVGRGDRRLADEVGVAEVAEIDHAGDGRGGPGAGDDDVVVVGVVVDHPLAQPVERRPHAGVEVGEPALDQRAPAAVLDVLQVVADPARLPQVPFELAVRRRRSRSRRDRGRSSPASRRGSRGAPPTDGEGRKPRTTGVRAGKSAGAPSAAPRRTPRSRTGRSRPTPGLPAAGRDPARAARDARAPPAATRGSRATPRRARS